MLGVSPAFIDLSREEVHLFVFSWKAILVFVSRHLTGSTETPVQIPGVVRSRSWGVEAALPPLADVPGMLTCHPGRGGAERSPDKKTISPAQGVAPRVAGLFGGVRLT